MAQPPQSGADKAFVAIVTEHLQDPRVTTRKMFGAQGLMVVGKVFGMAYKGKLVVKLTPARVDALVKAGKGEYFDSGSGRKSKAWFAFAPGRTARALFDEAKETTAKEAK